MRCAGGSAPLTRPAPPGRPAPPTRPAGERICKGVPAMTESDVRDLFTQIADGEPGTSQVDAQLARRRGRARLRWRRACTAGTPVLAAAAVLAVVIPAASRPPGHAPGPAARGQRAAHGAGHNGAATGALTPIAVASGVPGTAIPAGQDPRRIAITPD